MARRWLIGLLVVAGALVSPWAPAALAGTYSWPLPTASLPGDANPDHDSYGATPWSYLDGASNLGQPPASPASLQLLGSFSTAIAGGLTGWIDSADTSADAPFVAVNRSSAQVGEVPPGQLAVQPAHDRVVAVGWTSPFGSSQTVAVNGALAPDGQTPCVGQPTWTLEAQDGTVIASGGSGPMANNSISAAATVPAGGTIYLVVGWAGLYSQSCTTAGLSLEIQAPAATPSISLSSPTAGQTVSGAQPTFAGRASARFGDAQTVTVHIWRGSSASGTPVENLPTARSGDAYSVAASPPLANGTYTAQAEQDDLAGDVGLSAPVTFSIDNVAPKVTLTTLSSRPLLTSEPTITGTASTRPGDSSTVYVGIWPGSSVGGPSVRYLSTTRGADGSWSVRITPALPDGRYSVLAAQAGAGGVDGVSVPQTFRIKVHPPALTLLSPASGARLRPPSAILTGAAGAALGDNPTVSIAIYRGRRAHGRALLSSTVPVRGGHWRRRLGLRFAPGPYTLVVSQSDDAGHTVRITRTVTVLPPPRVIAGAPQLDGSDRAAVPIMCTATAGSCAGQVLVVTTRNAQPVPGGPSGPVRVLFAHVEEAAGATVLVRRSVPAYVARALRRAAPVRVRVSVALTDSRGRAIDASAVALLRLVR